MTFVCVYTHAVCLRIETSPVDFYIVSGEGSCYNTLFGDQVKSSSTVNLSIFWLSSVLEIVHVPFRSPEKNTVFSFQ